ncbi:MAG: hypothetical protein LBU41_06170 [Clostridiales Family XIII bacterium]|jgi:predicted small lipoprotein YifL|nr:hypothetical protein [Clostridiales Family XIII bacterium]
MKKSKIFVAWILVLILAMSMSLAACGEKSPTTTTKEPATNKVTSTESNISFEFPTGWSEEELNDVASIEQAKPSTEEYFILIEEPRDDFSDDFTLDGYAEVIANAMLEVIDSSNMGDWEEIQIGDADIPALQVEIKGEVENIKVAYLLTVFQSDSKFYQGLSWSLQSKYNSVKPNFQDILNTVDLG